MCTFPDFDSAMTFLIKNGFIAEPNNPTDQVATFVAHKVKFNSIGVIIISNDTNARRNVAVLGTLEKRELQNLWKKGRQMISWQ